MAKKGKACGKFQHLQPLGEVAVALFVNCAKIGSIAAALSGEYEKAMKVLNDLHANRCPWCPEG